MADNSTDEPPESAHARAPKAGMMVGNLGKPILLSGVNLCGVAAEPAKGPGNVKVWTQLAITSDEPVFHRVAALATQKGGRKAPATSRPIF